MATKIAEPKHKGLCNDLGNHVFDYSHMSSSDQMKTTWENIVHNVGTIYGQKIRNEMQKNKTVIIPKPMHTQTL